MKKVFIAIFFTNFLSASTAYQEVIDFLNFPKTHATYHTTDKDKQLFSAVLSLTQEEKNKLAEKIMREDWRSKPARTIFEVLSGDIVFAKYCKSLLENHLRELLKELSQDQFKTLDKVQTKIEIETYSRKQKEMRERVEFYRLRLLDALNAIDSLLKGISNTDEAQSQKIRDDFARANSQWEMSKHEFGSCFDKFEDLTFRHQDLTSQYITKELEVQAKMKAQNSLSRKDLAKMQDLYDFVALVLPIYQNHPLVYELCSNLKNREAFIKTVIGVSDENQTRILANYVAYGIKDDSFEDIQEIGKKQQVTSILKINGNPNVKDIVGVFPLFINGLQKEDKEYINFCPTLGELVSENIMGIAHHLANDEDDSERNSFCGDFLSLYFGQYEQALTHIPLFITTFKQIMNLQTDKDVDIFDISKIKERVTENFKTGILAELSEHYKTRIKPGYVMPHFDLGTTAKLEIKQYKGILNTYPTTFITSKGFTTTPHKIIIDFYGGKHKGFFVSKTETEQNFMDPIDDTMMVVGPLLGDESFDVSQHKQLTSEHFAKTHAVLLKRMSDCVGELRKTYPNAKIYLYGSSFGGFFGTSYAYHQAGGAYNSWAKEAIDKSFDGAAINKIDGIICHAPGLHLMLKIMQEGSSLKSVDVPTCLHFNRDDERVKLEEQLPLAKQISTANVLISTFGALPFFGEIEEKLNDPKTMRGHYNNALSQSEFDQQIRDFLAASST
jgi:hypothetical protein